MELYVLMGKRWIKISVLLACVCLLAGSGGGQESERHLVLVCSTEANIPLLSHHEVREVFLGVPTVKNGVRLKPLRNASDPLLAEVVLQKVIFMSKRNYKRQLASRVFRLGGARPPEFTDQEELTDALRASPAALTFMWSNQVTSADGIKLCGLSW